MKATLSGFEGLEIEGTPEEILGLLMLLAPIAISRASRPRRRTEKK